MAKWFFRKNKNIVFISSTIFYLIWWKYLILQVDSNSWRFFCMKYQTLSCRCYTCMYNTICRYVPIVPNNLISILPFAPWLLVVQGYKTVVTKKQTVIPTSSPVIVAFFWRSWTQDYLSPGFILCCDNVFCSLWGWEWSGAVCGCTYLVVVGGCALISGFEVTWECGFNSIWEWAVWMGFLVFSSPLPPSLSQPDCN